ncbi:hypothetical protein ColTof4_05861 [Colletotrichum tofieldiae]|nr:hypothetical protein ColTof3_01034 [Colletotrichum tofieldiae]GKT73438.1 hypothetical protein ColTof4_05861 [Colletotrichum tofieldiae]
MKYGVSKSSLECPIPGCKSGPFASTQTLARHKTAQHGKRAVMLCGKELQDVRYNYQRHLFDSCKGCKNILRELGGQDLRADFKDKSLDTLRRMHCEMVQQGSLPTAKEPSVTSAGGELEVTQEECKTSSSLTTLSTQTSEGRRYAPPVLDDHSQPSGWPSIPEKNPEVAVHIDPPAAFFDICIEDSGSFEMFTDRPCVCLEFNPSPESASFVEPDHHIFADPNHPTHYCGTGLNMEMDFQQDIPASTHFEDAIGSIQQHQIDFARMHLGWVLYEIDEE